MVITTGLARTSRRLLLFTFTCPLSLYLFLRRAIKIRTVSSFDVLLVATHANDDDGLVV